MQTERGRRLDDVIGHVAQTVLRVANGRHNRISDDGNQGGKLPRKKYHDDGHEIDEGWQGLKRIIDGPQETPRPGRCGPPTRRRGAPMVNAMMMPAPHR